MIKEAGETIIEELRKAYKIYLKQKTAILVQVYQLITIIFNRLEELEGSLSQ